MGSFAIFLAATQLEGLGMRLAVSVIENGRGYPKSGCGQRKLCL